MISVVFCDNFGEIKKMHEFLLLSIWVSLG